MLPRAIFALISLQGRDHEDQIICIYSRGCGVKDFPHFLYGDAIMTTRLQGMVKRTEMRQCTSIASHISKLGREFALAYGFNVCVCIMQQDMRAKVSCEGRLEFRFFIWESCACSVLPFGIQQRPVYNKCDNTQKAICDAGSTRIIQRYSMFVMLQESLQ